MRNNELLEDMNSDFDRLYAFFYGYSYKNDSDLSKVFFALYDKFKLIFLGNEDSYCRFTDNLIDFKIARDSYMCNKGKHDE